MPRPPDDARATLPRARRLKRRRLIRALFDRRRRDVDSVAAGCVRLVYRVAAAGEVGADVPVQVGFAPGRRAGSAVRRNQIKRHMREVYRRHQGPLVDLFSRRPGTLTLMVLFRGQADAVGARLRADLERALQQLTERLADEDAVKAPPPEEQR